MIFKRIKWFVLVAPITTLIAITFLILGLTVYGKLLTYAIFVGAAAFMTVTYLLFRYFSLKKNLGYAFEELSNNTDKIEYDITYKDQTIFINNLSKNKSFSYPVKELDTIYKLNKSNILFFSDNFSFIIPNNDEGKNFINPIDIKKD